MGICNSVSLTVQICCNRHPDNQGFRRDFTHLCKFYTSYFSWFTQLYTPKSLDISLITILLPILGHLCGKMIKGHKGDWHASVVGIADGPLTAVATQPCPLRDKSLRGALKLWFENTSPIVSQNNKNNFDNFSQLRWMKNRNLTMRISNKYFI